MTERQVVTSFLEHAGRILLLRRSDRVGTYRGYWAGVSGHLEPGVSPREQALTEIREETGLASEDVRLLAEGEPLVIEDQSLGRRWRIFPFRWEALRPEAVRLDWEHVDARWIAPAEIADYQTVPGLQDAWERVRG